MTATTQESVPEIGVVGCGLMGTGIAEVAAVAGISTVLVKATPGETEPVRARVKASLMRRVSRGKMKDAEARAALSRITVTTDRDALCGAELIVESIVEDLGKKRALFADLDGRVSHTTVFASNTSTLKISDIAAGIREDRTVGLHFFSPVPSMSLVELAQLTATTPEALNRARALVDRLGKTSVPVLDSTGFIVNRLVVPYLLNAIAAYGQGLATADQIDAAMKLGCGHPVGPLALSDLIGLDVVYNMSRLLYKEFGDSRYKPPALLRRLVQDNQLGRKTGLGLYDYSSRPAKPNRSLYELIRGASLGDTRQDAA